MDAAVSHQNARDNLAASGLRPSRKSRKTPRHHPVHFAPERHHEIGDAVEPLPAPGVEFRRLAVTRRQWIDFLFGAGETQREPFLALAAEFREAMRWRPVVRWKLVGVPIGFVEILRVAQRNQP
jgi:hypothetical protein